MRQQPRLRSSSIACNERIASDNVADVYSEVDRSDDGGEGGLPLPPPSNLLSSALSSASPYFSYLSPQRAALGWIGGEAAPPRVSGHKLPGAIGWIFDRIGQIRLPVTIAAPMLSLSCLTSDMTHSTAVGGTDGRQNDDDARGEGESGREKTNRWTRMTLDRNLERPLR